ncbi:MAG: hypothetical protein LM583_01575 [Desulfurococcaceae archaeon]|nr:hypothetical protein [Desulfurococcaceae archaeon]
MSSNSSVSRDELVELILSNNMLEDFVKWLRQKGVEADPISLRDIDYTYLYQFALEKKLIINNLEAEPSDNNEDASDLERRVQRYTKPKKIRRKT